MNKSYKVVFSKARGALMVVNELTSSVQAKGTKTVVAATIAALMAGAAVADTGAEADPAATKDETGWTVSAGATDKTISTEVTLEAAEDVFGYSVGEKGTTIVEGGKLTVKGVYYGVAGETTDSIKKLEARLNIAGGDMVVDGAGVQVNNFEMTAGSLLLTGTQKEIAEGNGWDEGSTMGSYNSDFTVKGGIVTLKKDARLWIGTDVDTDNADPHLDTSFEFVGGQLVADAGKDGVATISTYLAGSVSGQTIEQFVHLGGSDVDVKSGNLILLTPKVVVDAGTVDVAEGATLSVASQKWNVQPDGSDKIFQLTAPAEGGTASGTDEGVFELAGGMLTNKGTVAVYSKDTKVSGTAVVNNEGIFAARNVVVVDGGVFNTVSSGAKLAVANVTVGKGGTLNLLDLNSNYAGSTGETDTDVKDQYLLQYGLKLDGGELTHLGSALKFVKVGSDSKEGSLTVASSDYRFDRIITGAQGSVTVQQGASLEVVDLNLSGYGSGSTGVLTNNGSLTVGKVSVEGALEDDKVVNSGTIYTTFDQLAEETAAEGKWEKTLFGGAIAGDAGDIIETGYKGNYTLEQLEKIQTLGFENFTFANAKLVADSEKGGEVAFDAIATSGVTYLNTTNTVTTTVAADAATVTKDTDADITVGAIRVVDDKGAQASAKTLTVDGGNSGSLTIGGGDSDELFLGVTDSVNLLGTLTLGTEGTSNTVSQKVVIGTVVNRESTNGNVEVANTQTWKTGAVVASGSTLAIADTGALTVQNGLTNNGAVNVAGSLDVDYIEGAGDVLLTKGSLGILGNKPVAEETRAETPFSGAVHAGKVYLGQVGGNAVGIGATSAAAKAAAAEYFGEEAEGKNVYYIAKQFANTSMTLDSTYGVIVDLAGVAATEGFTAEDGVMQGTLLGEGGEIVLKNLTGEALMTDEASGLKSLRLAKAEDSTNAAASVDYGTIFYGTSTEKDAYGAKLTKNGDGVAESLTTTGKVEAGTISFAPNEAALQAVEGTYIGKAVEDAVKNVRFGENELVDAVVFGLDDAYVAAYNEAVAAGADAAEAKTYALNKVDSQISGAEEASVMAVTGGAFNVAIDVNNEVAKSLDRRMSVANGVVRAAQGINAWVDVIGTTNEAKGLFGDGVGYEADLYGAVLGADWTASCGAILGAAVAVGTGDANSIGLTGSKVENDVDYYGVSIYGSHQVGSVNGKFDIGYISTSNELSTTVFGQRVKEDLDADVFTIGLGAEYLAKAGSVNVVPHAGIRWSKIDVDDSRFGADYDAMNLFQMPIGVAFSGTFETAGWKLAPMVDLSVVPAFGDKNVDFSVAGVADNVRVVDTNPIQATLGLTAETGAWTFGVNYGLTAGSKDRMNNAFNATARYTF